MSWKHNVYSRFYKAVVKLSQKPNTRVYLLVVDLIKWISRIRYESILTVEFSCSAQGVDFQDFSGMEGIPDCFLCCQWSQVKEKWVSQVPLESRTEGALSTKILFYDFLIQHSGKSVFSCACGFTGKPSLSMNFAK